MVAEVEVDQHELQTALGMLGEVLRGPRLRALSFMDRYSVGLALLMPKVAQTQYQGDTFWEYFWDAVNADGDSVPEHRQPGLQSELGMLFLEGLDQAGLPRLEDFGRIYVDNILFHSGVPDTLLPRWFSLLDAAQNAVGPDPDQILEWARRKAAADRLYQPKPIERLAVHGGPFAADIVERSVQLLAEIRDGDPPTAERAGLPEAFVQSAISYCEETPAEGRPQSRGRDRGPSVRLDPWEGRLLISLPDVPDVPRLRWLVSLDGEEREIQPMRNWGPDGGFAASEVPLDSPIRRATVAVDGIDQVHILPIFDEDLPLLAFDTSGSRLPVSTGLPREQVWLLHPVHGAGQLVAADARALDDLGAPLGWTGWSLQLWDLSDATSLTLGEVLIPLHSYVRPQIHLDSVIEGMSSRGMPVYADRPRVVLPPGESDWTIDLLDYPSRRALQETVHHHGPAAFDPFAGWVDPVAGAFTVRVRGPYGRTASASFGLLEGGHVAYDPWFRIFDKDGLVPGHAKLEWSGADRPVLAEFGRAASGQVAVSSPLGHAQFTVEPPALAVAVQRGGAAPTPWLHHPVSVRLSELREGRLLLRIARGASPALHLKRGVETLQELDPTSVTAGRNVVYDLVRVGDTVAATGANVLTIGGDGGHSGIRVATIRPDELADGVALDDGVWLVNPVNMDLDVVLWTTGRPWEAPVVRRVSESGRVLLQPSDLISGRVVALPRLFDDWGDEEPAPRFPRKGTVKVSREAVPCEPLESSSPTEWLWASYLLDVMLPPESGMSRDESSKIKGSLRARPDSAIRLVAFKLPAVESAAALLRTGVAAMRCSTASPDSDSTMARAVQMDPVAASLVFMPQLVASGAELPKASEAARLELGNGAPEFIESGTDKDLTGGAFDPGALRMARLERDAPDVFRAEIESMSLRPVGLLHFDNRVLRSIETMQRGRARNQRLLAGSGMPLVRKVVQALHRGGWPGAAQAIVERRPADGWRSLSAATLAWSIALRFAPRDPAFMAILLDPASKPWRDRAHALAPQMAIDLVLAEIYACHAFPTAAQEPA